MKRAIALLLALVMVFALCGCGKSEEAKHADETIAAIGTVTEKSLSQIERAEAEVANLDEKEVKSLDNLTVLYDARAAYNELAAKSVEMAITAIGEVEFNSGDIIAAARQAYDAETKDVQVLVTNYDVLEKAEKELPTIRAGVVSDEIAELMAMPVETIDDASKIDDAIQSINNKYKMLDDSEKAEVKDYDKVAQKNTECESVLAQAVLKDVWFKTVLKYSHLELYIYFKNPNEKTIKYIHFGVMFENTVGDYLTYGGDPIYICIDTGPYETGKGRSGDNSYWKYYTSKLDIYDVKAVKLASVEIEYMDGTVVKIENPDAFDSVMKK